MLVTDKSQSRVLDADPGDDSRAERKQESVRSRLVTLGDLVREVLGNTAVHLDHVALVEPVIMQAIVQLDTAYRRTKKDLTLKAGVEEGPIEAEASRKGTERHPPALPSVLNGSLEQAAFRHPGVHSDLGSYDRLEILGDAYIELVATKLVWDRFPDLPSGRISQIRETLVKNETLAEYADMYGMDRRAILPKDLPKQSKRWTKTMGDIFESYVAAVIVSDPKNGYHSVEKWLTQLWTPKLVGLDQRKVTLAKQELAKKVMGKRVKLQYVDEHEPMQLQGGLQTFFIGVYLTGWGWTNRHLGSGKGSNKTIAGDQAAEAALLNTDLMDEIVAAKESWASGDNSGVEYSPCS